MVELTEIPALIYPYSKTEAAIAIVDSNLHRERILPSEKAFAYKMKMEALNEQGKRTDLTLSQVATRSDTATEIGKAANESRDQVFRYIRLTNLIPELLKLVDEERIALTPAVELSYLTEQEIIMMKGYLIAFATARGCAMSRFVEMIKPNIIVSNGGATISVNSEVIYRNLLSEKDVETVIAMCYEFTDGKTLITVENDDGYYCNFVPNDPDRRSVLTYSDFKNFRAPAYKVSPELEKDEWAEAIVKACSNCSLLNFTGEKWRRYAPVTLTKRLH